MNTQKEVIYIASERCYLFNCPHCDLPIQVADNEVNCQIFRHGVVKSTGQQVSPHLSKEKCDFLAEQNLVYGCCKPFKLLRNQEGLVTHTDRCDYV